jgi:ElaA protein
VTFVVRFEELAFDALSRRALYEALALRQRVFVLEQQCIFVDADGRDQRAMHVLGWHGERLVAYARILERGVQFEEHTIGRIVVEPDMRGHGVARELMTRAIASIEKAHGLVPMALAAQSRLEKFYASFGFERISDDYEEDGIIHVDMRRPARA